MKIRKVVGLFLMAVSAMMAVAADPGSTKTYCVIDVSGGSTAASYPVTYLDAVPSDGWTDEYKTDKIVLRRIVWPSGVYYAGVFEVTRAQWDKVMGGTRTSTKPKDTVSYNAIRGDAGTYNWPGSNAVDPTSFMGLLRQKTGLSTLDLPSEEEWEYAARAGVTTKWLCGDSETGLGDYAWYKTNCGDITHPVGTRRANAWGLYDVHGNVWEWCLNRYSSGDDKRAVRGGAYTCAASNCTFAHRADDIPSNGFGSGGFRLFLRSKWQAIVEIISAQMRETDPTVMDVKYRVSSTADKVNVRALAFENGVRSFANVVRPTTFLEGSVIGDNVPANTINSFSWKVSADWKVDLAQVSVEVLAQDVGAGLVPLDFVTIPAHGDYGAVTCSKFSVSYAFELRDALYWLYANGDADLSLKGGLLRDSTGRILVDGTDLQTAKCEEFIYGKMGYLSRDSEWQLIDSSDPRLSAFRRVQRETSGYVGKDEMDYGNEKTWRFLLKGRLRTTRNSLYMVIDLDGVDCGSPYSPVVPITYLDTAPATWDDEYKTRKIVLRRIDKPSGTYYAGVFEITEAQWSRVMGGTGTSTYPAVVSYDEIGIFMGELRRMTGLLTLDLPNGAEWEYAARAGVTTTWLCGDSETGLGGYAWYSANSDGGTHAVGTRRANAWGLYDVHGNVWEWTSDWGNSEGIETDVAFEMNTDLSVRVLRGGSRGSEASDCAFAYCDYYARSDAHCGRYVRRELGQDNSNCHGFRLFYRPELKK